MARKQKGADNTDKEFSPQRSPRPRREKPAGKRAERAGVNYTYDDTAHDHAVTDVGTADDYSYDANGNQRTHVHSGSSFTFLYDEENRLVSVTGSATATFMYDGDGNRIMSLMGGVTMTYIGNPSLCSGHGYFESVSSTSDMNVKSRYYYAGVTRVAVRTDSTLNYLLGDHSLAPFGTGWEARRSPPTAAV